MRIEGPLPVVQLLETTFLNLVNFASLVATNAARFRIAVGPDIQLLEFGLRRAQGPDGGLSASKYCYIGVFDGTSNVLAGKKFGIPIKGTHAHSFVNSFQSLSEVAGLNMEPALKELKPRGTLQEITDIYHTEICKLLRVTKHETNQGEMAAFLAYAQAFPSIFLCLIDTYSVLKSGLVNFLAVALALYEYGYQAVGIRLDSGDLAYLSKKCREAFVQVPAKYEQPWVAKLTIVASNDINEDTLHSLKEQNSLSSAATQKHQINSFGIGTHLVTCQRQPALGCVYKLVEIDEKPPEVNKRVLCRHPFQESKRAWVIPSKVESLYKCYWSDGQVPDDYPSLAEIRQNVQDSLKTLRQDHKRSLNPTPYKVGVSDDLYHFIHDLWLENQPIGELS